MTNTSIDPTKITNTNRTDAELQAFWVFCVIVAGKNSDYAARVVAKLLNKNKDQTPFERFKELGLVGVRNALVASKTGQYDRISRALYESATSLDLRSCDFFDLKSIHGVGPKSANFFLLHSREGYDGVVLDTHILRYLRNKGIDAPKSTPQDSTKYEWFSNLFKSLSAAEYPHMTLADRDLLIWKEYSGRA